MRINSLSSLNAIRQSLESARSRSASAESHFKDIESGSDALRKSASNVETYEARHDQPGVDVSDEGKAAVKTLTATAAKQQNLQGLHRLEEMDRQQLGNDLSSAVGDSQALPLPESDKFLLINAISNAQQSDRSGNFNYQAVDTALYTVDLQLPTAQSPAKEIAGDSKGKDVSLRGEQLQTNLDRLVKTFGDATSAADRSEGYQDRVVSQVEQALSEVDRLENKALQPYLGDIPFVLYAAREYALIQAFSAMPAQEGL